MPLYCHLIHPGSMKVEICSFASLYTNPKININIITSLALAKPNAFAFTLFLILSFATATTVGR